MPFPAARRGAALAKRRPRRRRRGAFLGGWCAGSESPATRIEWQRGEEGGRRGSCAGIRRTGWQTMPRAVELGGRVGAHDGVVGCRLRHPVRTGVISILSFALGACGLNGQSFRTFTKGPKHALCGNADGSCLSNNNSASFFDESCDVCQGNSQSSMCLSNTIYIQYF
jgi:hypothetical protein